MKETIKSLIGPVSVALFIFILIYLSGVLASHRHASKPLALNDLAATAGSRVVELTWTAVPSATSYNVYRAAASGGLSAKIEIALELKSPGYSDTSVTNRTSYYYQATAVNANGESSGSNEAIGIPQATIPPAPTKLFATTGSRAVGLIWTAAPGATSYNVYRATFSGGLSTKIKIKSWLKTPGCNDSSVDKGTVYYYQVTAVNEQGESSGSNESMPQSAMPAAQPKLSAAAGGGVVELTWTAVPGATSYKVYRAAASGDLSAKTKIKSGIIGRDYNDSTVTAGIIYYYQVTAINAQGESGGSNEVKAMPSSACTDNRDCPSGVCAAGGCLASASYSKSQD